MKNFSIFRDYIIRFCFETLFTLFLSLNLCLVYLLSNILYCIIANFLFTHLHYNMQDF